MAPAMALTAYQKRANANKSSDVIRRI
jgi:hypothetical protein